MRITHINMTGNESPREVQLMINRGATFANTVAEILEGCAESGQPVVPCQWLAELMRMVYLQTDEEVEKEIQDVTTKGMEGETESFHMVDGKRNFNVEDDSNIVDFTSARKEKK